MYSVSAGNVLYVVKREYVHCLWEIFEHSPYSPNVAPCDCHLFLHLQELLAVQSLMNGQETEHVVQGLTATFFDEGIQKLVPR
jgi:hypothetical protein